MEHYKEACNECVFEEKCSSYEKDENTYCISFVDLNFEVDRESWFEIKNDCLCELHPWIEMSHNRKPYGVYNNPVGGKHIRKEDSVFGLGEKK